MALGNSLARQLNVSYAKAETHSRPSQSIARVFRANMLSQQSLTADGVCATAILEYFQARIISIGAGKKQAKKKSFVRISEQMNLRGRLLRIIVGVSGASGSVYGFRLLQKLRVQPGIQIHLILSRPAERTAFLEMKVSAAQFRNLADETHAIEDVGSKLASGSFLTDGMVVAPCSIHSMSAIAHGLSDNLLVRAADVCLKERRKLVLMVRESPFHLGHLRTMTALAEMGAIIAPPVPGFYNNPKTIDDLVDGSVDRVLDLLGVSDPEAKRWDGGRPGPKTEA